MGPLATIVCPRKDSCYCSIMMSFRPHLHCTLSSWSSQTSGLILFLIWSFVLSRFPQAIQPSWIFSYRLSVHFPELLWFTEYSRNTQEKVVLLKSPSCSSNLHQFLFLCLLKVFSVAASSVFPFHFCCCDETLDTSALGRKGLIFLTIPG